MKVGFWDGKTPCWVLRNCPEMMRDTCPSYLEQSEPCWEMPDTACDRILGTEKTCDVCCVYQAYSGLADPAEDHEEASRNCLLIP